MRWSSHKITNARLFVLLSTIDGWEVPDPDTTTALLATTEVPPPSKWDVDTMRDPCTTVATTVVLPPATTRDTTAIKMLAVHL